MSACYTAALRAMAWIDDRERRADDAGRPNGDLPRARPERGRPRAGRRCRRLARDLPRSGASLAFGALNALYIRRSAEAAVRLTAGSAGGFYDETSPAWSPDGRSIAFLSDARSKGQPQVFVARSRRLARARKSAAARRRPTADVVAKRANPRVAVHPGSSPQSGCARAGARDVGVIGSHLDEQRLATIDVGTGTLHLLTPSDPTSTNTHGRRTEGRSRQPTPRETVTTTGGSRASRASTSPPERCTICSRPSFQINDPQWSPDGREIAIIGGIMSDFGSTGGDVYLVDAQTGEVARRHATARRFRRSRCVGTMRRVST